MNAYYNEIEPSAILWLQAAMDADIITKGYIDTRPIQEVTADDLRGYTQHHFFAGIGGWSIALRLAGWPDDKPVWTGSCPCQPFSSAGRQKGKADARHLWPVWERLIQECHPETIFGEQVASSEIIGTQLETSFAIAVQRGEYAKANRIANKLVKLPSFGSSQRWLDDVYQGLEAKGYAVGSAILPACSVGKAHRRNRLWFVGHSEHDGHPALPQSGSEGPTIQHDKKGQDSSGESEGAGSPIDVADTESSGGWVEREDTRQRRYKINTSSNTSGIGCRGGKSENWISCPDGKQRPVKPSITLLVNGLSGKLRKAALHGYGNAIVPQVAAEFIKASL